MIKDEHAIRNSCTNTSQQSTHDNDDTYTNSLQSSKHENHKVKFSEATKLEKSVNQNSQSAKKEAHLTKPLKTILKKSENPEEAPFIQANAVTGKTKDIVAENINNKPINAMQETPAIIDIASQALQETLEMGETLDKLNCKIRSASTFMQKSIQSNMDIIFKKNQFYLKQMHTKGQTKEQIELIREKIRLYTEQTANNLQKLREFTKKITEGLKGIEEIKEPNIGVENESLITDTRFIDVKSKGEYESCYNSVTTSNLIALTNSITKKIDVCKLQKNTNTNDYNLTFMCTLNKKPSFVIIHSDRIICDDEIYHQTSDSSFKLVQKLNEHDITGGVGLTNELLLVGYQRYFQLSLFKWTGSAYEKIQRARFSTNGENQLAVSNCQLKAISLAKQLTNEIYCNVGNHNFYHMELELKHDLGTSIKTKIHYKMKSKLLDYKQLSQYSAMKREESQNLIVILNEHSIFVVDAEQRIELMTLRLQYKISKIFLYPCFDKDENPIIVCRRKASKQLSTLNIKTGEYSTLQGGEGFVPLITIAKQKNCDKVKHHHDDIVVKKRQSEEDSLNGSDDCSEIMIVGKRKNDDKNEEGGATKMQLLQIFVI